jgi:hypothetical protein
MDPGPFYSKFIHVRTGLEKKRFVNLLLIIRLMYELHVQFQEDKFGLY